MVQLLAHIGDNKILFLLVLNVVLLVLGMFLDATAILIIVVPVLVPVATVAAAMAPVMVKSTFGSTVYPVKS